MVNLLILFLLAVNSLYCADVNRSIRGRVSVEYLGGVYHPNESAELKIGQKLIEGLSDIEFFYEDNGASQKLYGNKFFADDGFIEYSISSIRVKNYGGTHLYEGEDVKNIKFTTGSTYTIDVFLVHRCNVVLILDDDPAKNQFTINDVEFKTNCFSTDSVSNNTRDLFTAIENTNRKTKTNIGINLGDYRITEFCCSDGRDDCKDSKFDCYLDQMNKGDNFATLGLLFNGVFNGCKLLLLKLKKLGKGEPKVSYGPKRTVNDYEETSDTKSSKKCCKC